MCGVFGVYAPGHDVARLTYFGLFALQHRGQESAAIAVSEDGRLTALRDLGLVSQVFDEKKLHGLHGEVAIGHTGNLINGGELRDELSAAGVKLGTTSDTELVAALIANDEAPLAEATANAMRRLDGAYSIVALSEGRLVAFRDAHGFRPLVIGKLEDAWLVAS